MRVSPECAIVEGLAGAIALGEAADAERELYRAHLARCARCLNELGGEREIERVMATVARARDEERWEPRVAGMRAGRRRLRPAAATIAVAALLAGVLVLSIGERPKGTSSARATISASESRALAALGTQSVTIAAGQAESLAVGSSTLSTSLRVTVNGRGVPLRCTIAKSSGDRAFDAAICRAALRARVPATATIR